MTKMGGYLSESKKKYIVTYDEAATITEAQWKQLIIWVKSQEYQYWYKRYMGQWSVDGQKKEEETDGRPKT